MDWSMRNDCSSTVMGSFETCNRPSRWILSARISSREFGSRILRSDLATKSRSHWAAVFSPEMAATQIAAVRHGTPDTLSRRTLHSVASARVGCGRRGN